MPKISVLIPAYNVERYLPKCLDSVLSQTFDDFEVILINDGSTDGTGKICDDYAARDSRIKVYHQDNKGISATRNLCLQYAVGEYIQFVDSDDWIEPNMLEVMYNKARISNSDVVECFFYLETANASEPYYFCHSKKEDSLNDSIAGKWAVLWRHMFRTSLLRGNRIEFPKGIDGGEDYFFVVKSLVFSNKIASCEKFLYHYNYTNENSFIHKKSLKKTLYQYSATSLVENFLQQENLIEKYAMPLVVRKSNVKVSLIRVSFMKTYNIYSDVDLWSFIHTKWFKLKLLFGVSFLMNKFTFRRNLRDDKKR